MAVNTTVEVVMPPMGDSVSEGSILEWHKQEGDEVSEDETLVEISTDKVDAEVPAPVSGTVVKIHAAEGDTVGVGSVLAEIAPDATAPVPRSPRTSRPRPRPRPRPRRRREATVIEIEMPAMGESVSEGTILEWAKQPGDSVAEDETIVEISTDKVDAEVPAPASGTLTEVLADAGDTVTVGQVIARMTSGNGAAPREGRPEARADRDAPGRRHRDDPHARGPEGHAGRRSASPPRTGSTSRSVKGTGPDGRIGKADVLAFQENGARRRSREGRGSGADRAASRPCSRARARCSRATWTSRGRSRPRRRSAPSPSPTSTRAASSSRRPATRSPSRT